eukprot:RCo039618
MDMHPSRAHPVPTLAPVLPDTCSATWFRWGAHDSSGGSSASTTNELFFIFMSLMIGVLSRRYLARLGVPYSVLVYCYGIALGQIGILSSEFEATVGMGIYRIDPNLTMALFLPLLIFEAAFNIPLHVFKRVFTHSVVLAVPGVLVNVALLGLTLGSMYKSWRWIKALTFACIVSTTDPVAVVGVLREQGVSQTIATMIEGESLLNDASAIALFMVLKKDLSTNVLECPWLVPHDFILIAVAGPCVGYILSRVLLYFVRHTFNDPFVEAITTFSAAYLTWYAVEQLFGVSAVLAVLAVGLEFNHRRTAISPEVAHFMEQFLSLMSFAANTLIFMIMGIETRMAIHDQNISPHEVAGMFVLYVAVNLFRFLMVALFHPFLGPLHSRIDWKCAVLLGWSGLRGPVSMALALNVRKSSFEPAGSHFGSSVAFHV